LPISIAMSSRSSTHAAAWGPTAEPRPPEAPVDCEPLLSWSAAALTSVMSPPPLSDPPRGSKALQAFMLFPNIPHASSTSIGASSPKMAGVGQRSTWPRTSACGTEPPEFSPKGGALRGNSAPAPPFALLAFVNLVAPPSSSVSGRTTRGHFPPLCKAARAPRRRVRM
jgi:hypothetical protein